MLKVLQKYGNIYNEATIYNEGWTILFTITISGNNLDYEILKDFDLNAKNYRTNETPVHASIYTINVNFLETAFNANLNIDWEA